MDTDLKEMKFIENSIPLYELGKYGCIVNIVPNKLWVVERIGVESKIDALHFVQFHSQEISPNTGPIEVSSLFIIEGFSDSLREGRHTYFPEKGYIFYMNADNMIAALTYCKKYFDMD